MERLRRWYLNFSGGEELGPDKLMSLFILVVLAAALLGRHGLLVEVVHYWDASGWWPAAPWD